MSVLLTAGQYHFTVHHANTNNMNNNCRRKARQSREELEEVTSSSPNPVYENGIYLIGDTSPANPSPQGTTPQGATALELPPPYIDNGVNHDYATMREFKNCVIASGSDEDAKVIACEKPPLP